MVEGLGIWGKTGEVGIVDLGEKNRSDLVELFKISKGLSAISWDSFFWAGNSERTRDHSMKLARESFKLEVRKNFFSQGVVSMQLEWVE